MFFPSANQCENTAVKEKAKTTPKKPAARKAKISSKTKVAKSSTAKASAAKTTAPKIAAPKPIVTKKKRAVGNRAIKKANTQNDTPVKPEPTDLPLAENIVAINAEATPDENRVAKLVLNKTGEQSLNSPKLSTAQSLEADKSKPNV